MFMDFTAVGAEVGQFIEGDAPRAVGTECALVVLVRNLGVEAGQLLLEFARNGVARTRLLEDEHEVITGQVHPRLNGCHRGDQLPTLETQLCEIDVQFTQAGNFDKPGVVSPVLRICHSAGLVRWSPGCGSVGLTSSRPPHESQHSRTRASSAWNSASSSSRTLSGCARLATLKPCIPVARMST